MLSMSFNRLTFKLNNQNKNIFTINTYFDIGFRIGVKDN